MTRQLSRRLYFIAASFLNPENNLSFREDKELASKSTHKDLISLHLLATFPSWGFGIVYQTRYFQ